MTDESTIGYHGRQIPPEAASGMAPALTHPAKGSAADDGDASAVEAGLPPPALPIRTVGAGVAGFSHWSALRNSRAAVDAEQDEDELDLIDVPDNGHGEAIALKA